MATVGCNRDDHLLWRRSQDLGPAVQVLDCLKHAWIWSLQREPAVKCTNNYVSLDWTSPSLTSESMQALISG
jgi:hypothetical protein